MFRDIVRKRLLSAMCELTQVLDRLAASWPEAGVNANGAATGTRFLSLPNTLEQVALASSQRQAI
ncbi:MAG: hypothetical protein NTU91_08735 [Chloroflexi bacterium]|nr:hypothetical protein [Chloroflexota bacterium]